MVKASEEIPLPETFNHKEFNMVKYLNKTEASQFLKEELGISISKTTLSKYITQGGSPVYRKFGRRVLYTPEDLIAWANARMSKPRLNSSCEKDNDE